MRGLRRPSPSLVISLIALFVALGGTTYAATGGNFILGQANTATSQTSLTSNNAGKALNVTQQSTGTGATALGLNVPAGKPPFTVNSGTKVGNLNADKLDGIDSTGFVRKAPPISLTGPGGEDVLTAINTGNGRGLAGFSDSWQGVYGHSNSNAGVVGESTNFDGVFGVSNGLAAGVSGHNNAGGWGVWAEGGSVANNTSAIHGQSANGNALEGISQKNIASGVYGENDSTGYGVAGRAVNGIAVVGDSSNGWAFQALGDATQARDGGGFVKAMALIDPFQSNPIVRCFNSQVPRGSANCGMSYSRTSACNYVIGFGFRVDDRFVSVTGSGGAVAWGTSPVAGGPTLLRVIGACSDLGFYINVY